MSGAKSGTVDTDPRHALVVGGSGMLRGVVLQLARPGRVVTVVARGTDRLKSLAQAVSPGGGHLHPVQVDYRDSAQLSAGLQAAQQAHGPIEPAVVWMHGTAPTGPEIVARAVGQAASAGETAPQGSAPCRFFHVLGSAAADPSQPQAGRRERIIGAGHIQYHEVILGFVPGRWRSRWLTDAEISAGVLAAIASGLPRHVVGTVEPWSARP